MKSFGTYISKHLASFAAFLLILVIVNVVLYGVTFYHTVSEDYGEASPHAMLELTSTAATTEGLPDYAEQKLRQYNIWAMYLTSTGECFWRLDVPQEVPQHYSIQEVALFSKGYLEDYPVFVWSTEDGLLVLGYPKNSYMKLTSNYYSMETMVDFCILVQIANRNIWLPDNPSAIRYDLLCTNFNQGTFAGSVLSHNPDVFPFIQCESCIFVKQVFTKRMC